MDSLSQIVLGAAVAELTLGRKLGNKAMLVGAVAGTIPDLDILLNGFIHDPIEQLRIHRGYSHSMFVHLILAVPFAWASSKMFRADISLKRWYLAWYLCFFTHALLDCCTTYGTQLFLPFTDHLVGFNTISVVDPLWTMPFLMCLVIAMFFRRERSVRRKWAIAGTAWGVGYLILTLGAKAHVHSVMQHSLEEQRISYDALSTSPSIFNAILWSGIAESKDSLYLGEYSWLQEDRVVEWVSYARNDVALDSIPLRDAVHTLRWFSQGKYFAVPRDGGVDFFHAKWGRMDFTQRDPRKAIAFHWRLQPEGDTWRAFQVQSDFDGAEMKQAFRQLWRRLFSREL